MISDIFRLEAHGKIDKVIDLKTAVKTYVQDGMLLYLSRSAEAAACEIIRQFWYRNPGFTLMMSLPGGAQAMNLIHRGLVKKFIFTTCADLYPKPSPNPIIQRAFRQKNVKLENWSVLTFTQALMAGSLDLPFMPTLSVKGSHIADENSQSFTVIKDPFEKGEIGIVKRINPDIAFYHGWAADPEGNTILVPYGDDRDWGAKASKNGVVVTVERLVTTDFIRRRSDAVKIPAYMVNAVVVAPFGAHPRAMSNIGLPEFESYDADSKFLTEYREASKKPETLDAWIKEWILDCKTHDDHIKKLGLERIYEIRGKAGKDVWKHRFSQVQDKAETPRPYNETEYAIIGASRKIKDVFLKREFKAIFAGVGMSALSGWCAFYSLKEEGHEVYMVGSGIGFEPRPADPLMVTPSNIATSRVLAESIDIHGVCVGGIKKACLGVLGAAQIDKYGNVNSSKIGDKVYIAGAGGGNDIASGAREVVVVTKQKKERFLENVPYITCPGKNISTLVSNDGVYEKNGLEFELTSYFVKDGSDQKEHINRIKENCGWALTVSKNLGKIPEPTKKELMLLRSLDPEGVFIS